MANSSEDKRAELESAAGSVTAEAPLDGASKEYLEITTQGSGSDKEGKEIESRAKLEQTKSYATTASALSQPQPEESAPKKWYKKLNPLKWGTIPPVPEERQVSREYNAPFLSLIYFQWVAPIMSVSLRRPASYNSTNSRRLGINDNLNKMISGP
jgi:ATP-binding cassette subfamily C (CFTR/MRP) protein 1